MFARLRRWLERRRRHREAVAVACRHFEAVTGKVAHVGISSVIGEDAGGFVVRVCHGQGRPPGRAWFRVGIDGRVSGDLSFDDVQRFGEGLWR